LPDLELTKCLAKIDLIVTFHRHMAGQHVGRRWCYYSGGGRIVDVSAELRGDLYRQGREIGRLWSGPAAPIRIHSPKAFALI
jgi:hypothetical protein